MILIQSNELFLLLLGFIFPVYTQEYETPIRYVNDHESPSRMSSIFSPRMDFEQWKPLTGRGDPLRNDPTYDYEPPLLERVHYWADDAKVEREHVPEKKSEVLMLGVSSRKPSVTPRPHPPRRQQFRIPPSKYEDFTYKLSNNYPMTILVPPPLPPPGHQPALFVLNQVTPSQKPIKTDTPVVNFKETTKIPDEVTSLYALQASNLIFQSSTVSHNWINDINDTSSNSHKPITSDYAGWGPTTPINEYEIANDTHNLISHDHFEVIKHPYSFYKPMLSESPPPPEIQSSLFSTFLPTSLPPTTQYEETTPTSSIVTWPTEKTTYETSTENQDYYEDTTETSTVSSVVNSPIVHSKPVTKPHKEVSLLDMLSPMMSMPINGAERPEDNLYQHASESMQIFKERKPDPILNLETMQPPPLKSTITNPKTNNHGDRDVNMILHKKPVIQNHDPYLNMRYTTSALTSATEAYHDSKTTTESSPMYLIIQGHSKVKTYGSKPKPNNEDVHTFNNEIPKLNITNEVKHLHPKQKFGKKLNIIVEGRKSKAHNLKTLVDHGLGSIEIQEADVGIKYDVSDGSNVPLEVYKKGIVVTDENNYKSGNKIRTKRQIDLEDLLPFDEDTLEEFVYNFFEGKRNETTFTGAIAQAVTSDAASAVDELEDDESNETEQDEDDR